MPDLATYQFQCPTCQAQYKVVRVEMSPTHDNPVLCLGCGGPIQNREGKFALKYFRVEHGRRGPNYFNDRSQNCVDAESALCS
jgi:hypothetical protein